VSSTGSSVLTVNQRLILMIYSTLATGRSAVLEKTGAERAKLLDLDAIMFSRLQPQPDQRGLAPGVRRPSGQRPLLPPEREVHR
jgi:hypothetical protein